MTFALLKLKNCYFLCRKLGLDVIELQADDTLPDSIFIDCVAVICNGTALIAKPHLISRRKEVNHMTLYGTKSCSLN